MAYGPLPNTGGSTMFYAAIGAIVGIVTSAGALVFRAIKSLSGRRSA